MKLIIANKNYSSWSLRPWILMRILNIEFTECLVPFGSEDFSNGLPNKRVPCLVDGDETVWDSLGIVEYLAESCANVWPTNKAARTWARCVSAEMHSEFRVLREKCTTNLGVRVALPAISEALARDIGRIEEVWAEGMKRFGGPWLAGERFTAVDAFFAPVAFRFQTYSLSLAEQAAAYRDRLLNLPDMQCWYADALKEPWRDNEHEVEAARTGIVIADYRASDPE